ncbi:MAG: hypothetical protein H8E62_11560 [Planctomycetes bacterium]|nr:hypothetical protein [Planctomycetota bacterium]
MEPTTQRPQDIVDTTDSLEAVGASKSMKNFLFLVILIGLLLPQIIFWMDRMGLVEQKACTSCSMRQSSCPEKSTCPVSVEEKATPAPLALAATVDVAQEVEKVAVQVEQDKQSTQAASQEDLIILEKETDTMPAEQVAVEPETATDSELDVAALFGIPCRTAKVLVVVCNFFVLTGAVLYSLVLLMCLKISLTGRLGGINHIARAFFISLFLLIVLIPWQRILPGVLIGAVWLPGELLCGGWELIKSSAFWKVLFYLRFVGLWVLAMWLLLWTQVRSGKWARATLRRLGVVR